MIVYIKRNCFMRLRFFILHTACFTFRVQAPEGVPVPRMGYYRPCEGSSTELSISQRLDSQEHEQFIVVCTILMYQVV